MQNSTADQTAAKCPTVKTIVIHTLTAMFAVTSWTVMNGLWVEFPMMVSRLPEGWALPSYVTIIAQFGNIGPVVFSLLVYLFPTTKLEVPFSIGSLLGLILVSFLYGDFWSETTFVFGEERSIALLVLTFIQATFAATSTMSYMTLMAHFNAKYIRSLFVGMSLSGLIPALAAVGQGLGNENCFNNNITVSANNSSIFENINETESRTADNTILKLVDEPNFTVKAFFFMLSGVGFISLFSLLCLLYHPYCKSEHVDLEQQDESDGDNRTVGSREVWCLLLFQMWINMLQTSFTLAIQVYSSLPYGLFFFNAAARTENIVDPIASIMNMFKPAKRKRTIYTMLFLGTLFTGYIISIAASSPSPFVKGNSGGIIIISAWVGCTFFMIYAKVGIGGIMRLQGRRFLLWNGRVTQFGAFVGAIVSYVMINHLKLFKDGGGCTEK